jgi:hypothetical protein
MKKWIAVGLIALGITGGLVGGFAAGAHATAGKYTGFYSSAEWPNESNVTQRGYIMGVFDTLSYMADDDGTPGYISDTVECMKRFQSAEALRLWALRRMASQVQQTGAIDALLVFKSIRPCGF